MRTGAALLPSFSDYTPPNMGDPSTMSLASGQVAHLMEPRDTLSYPMVSFSVSQDPWIPGMGLLCYWIPETRRYSRSISV